MTQTFFVGSKIALMVPQPVQGTGDNTTTAQLAALHAARILRHIDQPVVLTPREALVMTRRWAERHAIELVRTETPARRSPMCFDNRYATH